MHILTAVTHTHTHTHLFIHSIVFQCQFTSTGPSGFTGACPDRQNDVTSVTGYREGCTTCIKYQRPLSTNDSQDSSYSLDMDQSIIWAMGPVGNIRTPTQETIPVPFRHYVNADPSGKAFATLYIALSLSCLQVVLLGLTSIEPQETSVTYSAGLVKQE